MAIMGYTRGDILRYIFLPQVLPRVRDLFHAGFGHLAFFVAQVFRAGGILPPNHAFLQINNIGHYGLLDVLAEVSRLIPFDRHHIDKVIFFFAILAGFVILAIQCFLLLLAVFIGPAAAQADLPNSYSGFLTTQNPEKDIAFKLMDSVFGIPDMFPVEDPVAENSAFHAALHGLFQFYSLGLLVIAAIILAYFVMAIVAETAETGTPFGKRYNHVWAPVRLVVALGLLIPMGYGLNAAQWITLYSAKFGSGFATNGWLEFNKVLGEQYKILSGEEGGEELVHVPERPDPSELIAYMNFTLTCKHALQERKGLVIKPYLVKNATEGEGKPMPLGEGGGPGGGGGSGSGYQQARAFFNQTGNIFIRFGVLDQTKYPDQKGYVAPLCGEIMLPTPETHRAGAEAMNKAYYNMIGKLWGGNISSMDDYAKNDAACTTSKVEFKKKCVENKRPNDFAQKATKIINDDLDKAIKESVDAQRKEFLKGVYGEGESKGTIDELKQFGWGGAGIYYNTVATMNGAIATSLHSMPYPILMPQVVEDKKEETRQQNKDSDASAQQSSGKPAQVTELEDAEIVNAIQRTQDYWKEALSGRKSENMIIDAIDVILGTNALFAMCKNADVHPLAQLAGLGRSLMESATRNLGIALGSSILGLGLGAASLTSMLGSVAGAASSFYITFAMIGLMMGFIMYYVVPFMPFLYFFFAVTGWVKGIFEAMVGMPLWALAHLRIDGQGLPGDAAAQGYFLILEIFLRPILIIFGLLAAISVFAAMVRVLNETFVLVVSNVGGFNTDNIDLCGKEATSSAAVGSADYYRGPVDQFFFTVVYAIVVYLIGTSSFKMIDAVPNKILRWMGAGVNSFGDMQKDAGEGLLQKLSVGGYAVTSQLQGAFSSVGNFFSNGKGQGALGFAAKAADELGGGQPPQPSGGSGPGTPS